MRFRLAVLGATLLAAAAPRDAAADKNAFFRALDERPVAEFRDLVAVVHMLAWNAHEEKPFEDLRAELVVKGILPDDWTYKPESPVTRSMAAYGICAAMENVGEGEYSIHGGLTLMVFGNSERYALRECIHLGIVMPGYSGRYVRGGELLGILARAQAYRRTGKAQTLQMDDETEAPPDAGAEPVQQERMQRQEAPK